LRQPKATYCAAIDFAGIGKTARKPPMRTGPLVVAGNARKSAAQRPSDYGVVPNVNISGARTGECPWNAPDASEIGDSKGQTKKGIAACRQSFSFAGNM
jgi:hypothetical protein